MQDNFKQFINSNQEEFDFDHDVDKAWNAYSKANKVGKKKSNNAIWFAAASISILLSITVILINRQQPVEPTAEVPLTEWQEAELFYRTQIDEMSQLVSAHPDGKIIEQDLEQIDKAMREIKDDLKDGVSNEVVIEAMMDHYRLKLEILEQMLLQIKEQDENIENTIVL